MQGLRKFLKELCLLVFDEGEDRLRLVVIKLLGNALAILNRDLELFEILFNAIASQHEHLGNPL